MIECAQKLFLKVVYHSKEQLEQLEADMLKRMAQLRRDVNKARFKFEFSALSARPNRPYMLVSQWWLYVPISTDRRILWQFNLNQTKSEWRMPKPKKSLVWYSTSFYQTIGPWNWSYNSTWGKIYQIKISKSILRIFIL